MEDLRDAPYSNNQQIKMQKQNLKKKNPPGYKPTLAIQLLPDIQSFALVPFSLYFFMHLLEAQRLPNAQAGQAARP